MSKKLFDAERKISLRTSQIAEQINELQNEMIVYEHACHKIEDVINSVSKLELYGRNINLHSVEVYDITKLTSEDHLSRKVTTLSLVYRFDPKYPIETDWYHNDKDTKYLTKLKESLIRIMEQRNLKQINIDDMYFDVFINEDETEEMCMVFMFEFNHIKYGD